jgi:vacuolar iron transporter family protein
MPDFEKRIAKSGINRRTFRMYDLRGVSFGSPAAIVTCMALIVGLDAATVGRVAVVSSLLIIGIADNLTDSLSIHIYQEAECMAERPAFRTTLSNFAARLAVTCGFVLLFFAMPVSVAIYLCLAWGFGLLSLLSYFLARARGAKPFSEIWKHATVAASVILISRAAGVSVQHLMR